MTSDKTTRQNRVREALGRIYDQHPPLFREYLRRFQEDPTSRVFAPLAEAYRRLGRGDEAIEICLEGLTHHPEFHGGRVALAKCYFEKKRYPEAQVELERVVKAVPENLLAQKLLGDTLFALKKIDAALHCYKMALLLSPTDVQLAEKVHAIEKLLANADFSGRSNFVPPANLDSSSVLNQLDGLGENFPALWEEVEAGFPLPEFESELEAESAPKFSPKPLADTLVDKSATMGRAAPSAFTVDVPVRRKLPSTPTIVMPSDDEVSETESSPEINALLGMEESAIDEEAFRIEHVSAIFSEQAMPQKKEITTETLGDLYFSQGQHDRALRIFEKLHEENPTTELEKKVMQCRVKLGVDREALVRQKQIDYLRSLVKTVGLAKTSASRRR